MIQREQFGADPQASGSAGERKMETGRLDRVFADLSSGISKVSGRPLSTAVAALFVLAWAATGPWFHYSDTWQLVVNTGSSIVTFLMVFLIQNTQARDSEAMQAKLDEIIRVLKDADDSYRGIERLPDKAIEEFRALKNQEQETEEGKASPHAH